jgi:hypothetical protein
MKTLSIALPFPSIEIATPAVTGRVRVTIQAIDSGVIQEI